MRQALLSDDLADGLADDPAAARIVEVVWQLHDAGVERVLLGESWSSGAEDAFRRPPRSWLLVRHAADHRAAAARAVRETAAATLLEERAVNDRWLLLYAEGDHPAPPGPDEEHRRHIKPAIEHMRGAVLGMVFLMQPAMRQGMTEDPEPWMRSAAQLEYYAAALDAGPQPVLRMRAVFTDAEQAGAFAEQVREWQRTNAQMLEAADDPPPELAMIGPLLDVQPEQAGEALTLRLGADVIRPILATAWPILLQQWGAGR